MQLCEMQSIKSEWVTYRDENQKRGLGARFFAAERAKRGCRNSGFNCFDYNGLRIY